MIERQELFCHECQNYVQFDIDTGLNGNHVLRCPNCDHEHCRVVENGVITDHRWDSRNPSIAINNSGITWTATSTYGISNIGTNYTLNQGTTAATIAYSNPMGYITAYPMNSTSTAATTGGLFLYNSWMNKTVTS